MKVIKSILITLIALLLTGCYTQLQYSQKMHKITDKNKKEVQKNYQSGEEQTNNEAQAESDEQYADYAGEEDYVPVSYKDYEYVQKYADCNCSPYNVYNFYGSSYDWYGYNYYKPYYSFRSHLTLSPFYYHNWRYPHHFGYSRFAFSFSWGSPHFYHSFYHDPFYDYYFGYSPFAYNYHRFYGSYGYGYYYGGSKENVSRDSDVRYGPRSIGTNRVVTTTRERSNSVRNESGRRTKVNNKAKVQTRSVGTTRSRGTVKQNTGSSTVTSRNRSRSDEGNSSGTTRSRSRNNDNIQSDNSRNQVYIDRTGESTPVLIDRDRYDAVRSRTIINRNSPRDSDTNNERNILQRVRKVNLNTIEQEKPTFFQRMKGFIESSTSRINTTRSSSSSVRSWSTSSSNRSSVSRTKSSSSRSSVSQSNSSSSNSRSRGGSSSSSRSRSGGNSDSSSSDRNRGN
jgi:hypothetical protein